MKTDRNVLKIVVERNGLSPCFFFFCFFLVFIIIFFIFEFLSDSAISGPLPTSTYVLIQVNSSYC